MNQFNHSEHQDLLESDLAGKLQAAETPKSMSFELTARCNNNCKHCYINLPRDDAAAQSLELSLEKIEDIADQAMANGVLWCLLTGGEPILRKDFSEIYSMLKKKGLLVSVFTNACLIDENHIRLFRRYNPRDLEVTVYGMTAKTYEKVTGVKGSFARFKKGLALILENGVPVSLKAMAIRSNVHEIEEIARFCSKYSKRKFRFDPFLHKRYDFDEDRNSKIDSERLSTDEIVQVENNNLERKNALIHSCDSIVSGRYSASNGELFDCGILKNGLQITYDGRLRLCSSLLHPDFTRDLYRYSLLQAYEAIAHNVTNVRSVSQEFKERCGRCRIRHFCYFCPATSYLETGELDQPVDLFCENAQARHHAIFMWKNMEEVD